MTRDEAIELLESNDFCMTHFVQTKPSAKNSRKRICEECETDKREAMERQFAEAIYILRGNAPRKVSDSGWINCDVRHPAPGKRVQVIALGFLETGRAGNKPLWTIGSKPSYWRNDV